MKCQYKNIDRDDGPNYTGNNVISDPNMNSPLNQKISFNSSLWKPVRLLDGRFFLGPLRPTAAAIISQKRYMDSSHCMMRAKGWIISIKCVVLLLVRRVIYYNNITTNTADYTVWYPLIAMQGTPCSLANSVQGVRPFHSNNITVSHGVIHVSLFIRTVATWNQCFLWRSGTPPPFSDNWKYRKTTSCADTAHLTSVPSAIFSKKHFF